MTTALKTDPRPTTDADEMTIFAEANDDCARLTCRTLAKVAGEKHNVEGRLK